MSMGNHKYVNWKQGISIRKKIESVEHVKKTFDRNMGLGGAECRTDENLTGSGRLDGELSLPSHRTCRQLQTWSEWGLVEDRVPQGFWVWSHRIVK